MTANSKADFGPTSFKDILKAFSQPKMAMMLVLGFTAGLPFLLYFSVLSTWLAAEEIDVALISFFSYFGLAWSFKFLWAPILDRYDPPGLTRLFGHRRAWIFVAQISLALAMFGMGFSNPSGSLAITALFSFLIAFSSATQDIGIDAWRIEAAADDGEQAILAAAYQYGYRVGMIVAGGVALIVADVLNFSIAYWTMGGVVILAAFVFSIWDRKGGIRTAALAGIMLLLVAFGSAADQFSGIFTEGSAIFNVLIWLSRSFYTAALLCLFLFIVSLFLALRSKETAKHFTLSDLLIGIAFAILCFIGIATLAILLGLAIPKIFSAMGIQPSRSQIAQIAVFVAATPLILCAIATPFIRRLKDNAPVWKNPSLTPFIDFFWRYGWIAILILGFVSSYRLSDIVMGVVAKPAYIHMGYGPGDIGIVSGTYGIWITFVGVALAGISAIKLGLRTSLIIGAIVSVLGNLTFSWLVMQSPNSLFPLFVAVTADNIAGGYAGTVFIAFMSSMVTKSFAGTQYAIFSSAWSLGPKLIAGTSGIMVNYFSGGVDAETTVAGYSTFFLVTGLIGIPAILLSFLTNKMKPDRDSFFAKSE